MSIDGAATLLLLLAGTNSDCNNDAAAAVAIDAAFVIAAGAIQGFVSRRAVAGADSVYRAVARAGAIHVIS